MGGSNDRKNDWRDDRDGRNDRGGSNDWRDVDRVNRLTTYWTIRDPSVPPAFVLPFVQAGVVEQMPTRDYTRIIDNTFNTYRANIIIGHSEYYEYAKMRPRMNIYI